MAADGIIVQADGVCFFEDLEEFVVGYCSDVVIIPGVAEAFFGVCWSYPGVPPDDEDGGKGVPVSEGEIFGLLLLF